MQVGDIKAGIELGDVEFPAVDFCLPAWIRINVNFQIDSFRLDRSVDQRPRAIVGTAGHREF